MTADDAAERVRCVVRGEHLLATLRGDALAVWIHVGERLELGQRRYGVLRLAVDPRNWRRELLEELLDVLVYRAICRLLGLVGREGRRAA